MCPHRDRNWFSPYKNGACSITQLLPRPKVSKSHCVISQEPFVQCENPVFALCWVHIVFQMAQTIFPFCHKILFLAAVVDTLVVTCSPRISFHVICRTAFVFLMSCTDNGNATAAVGKYNGVNSKMAMEKCFVCSL